jgi:hypothetical protein
MICMQFIRIYAVLFVDVCNDSVTKARDLLTQGIVLKVIIGVMLEILNCIKNVTVLGTEAWREIVEI